MYKNSRGDIIASTLDYYRERTRKVDNSVPDPYKKIKKKLQKIADQGRKVLIDVKDSYTSHTVIVRLEYIHDRWAMGKSICYTREGEIEVPYTIHYSDIHCKGSKIKVIPEGENPFKGGGK